MREAPPSPQRLRVGLLVAGNRLPRHVAHVVAQLAADGPVMLVAVLREPGQAAPLPLDQRLAAAIRDAYLCVDRRVFRVPDDALGTVEPTLPAHVARVEAPWRRSPGDSAHVSPEASARVAALGLDVIVDPGLDEVRPGFDALARLGRWQLTPERGGWPVLLGDLDRGAPTSRAWVARVQADSRLEVLDEAVVPCSPLSLARNQSTVRWQSAHLLLRALGRVASDGQAARRAEQPSGSDRITLADEPPPPGEAPRPVSSARAVALTLRLLGRVARRAAARALWREGWYVAVRERVGQGTPPDHRGFRPLAVPGGGFVADPQLVADGARDLLFVEAVERRVGRGHIDVMELDSGGRAVNSRTVLEAPHHLSYPFVVRWRDAWYMVPESWDAGRVDLYRATEFPGSWVREGTLLEGVRAADPTIHVHDGRLWLFLTLTERGLNPWDELSLFVADEIHGPWRPHPANPIVTDVRRARPAGPLLEVGEQLLRPAQDCSASYGRRIVLNRVDRLDLEGYAETPIGTIEPRGRRGLSRTHCYARSDRWEALDGYRRERRLPLPWGRSVT